jgi:hypothetical protein
MQRVVVLLWLVSLTLQPTLPPFGDAPAMEAFMVQDELHYGRRMLSSAADELRQMADRFQQRLDAMNHHALERAYQQREAIRWWELMQYLPASCPLPDDREAAF